MLESSQLLPLHTVRAVCVRMLSVVLLMISPLHCPGPVTPAAFITLSLMTISLPKTQDFVSDSEHGDSRYFWCKNICRKTKNIFPIAGCVRGQCGGAGAEEPAVEHQQQGQRPQRGQHGPRQHGVRAVPGPRVSRHTRVLYLAHERSWTK